LAEAGYKDGFDLSIGGYADAVSVRRAEFLRDQLVKVGVRLKFTNGTVAEISAHYYGQEKKFDALVSAWTGRPDPAMTYGLMYGKDAYFNAGRVEGSPALTEPLAKSRESGDTALAKQVFSRIQRIVVEQAAAVPLGLDAVM